MQNLFQRQTVPWEKIPAQVAEKWSAQTLREGFVPFPKKLLRCMHRLFSGDSGTKELAVVLSVVDFRRPSITRRPSQDYLAFVSGLSRPEFDSALQSLVEKGYVKIAGDELGLDVKLDGLMTLIEKEAHD